MIDFAITKMSKSGREGVNQEKREFTGTGRGVVRWASGAYRAMVPKVRYRAATMVGDVPVVATEVFLGVLAKCIEAIDLEGEIEVALSFDEISFYAREIRFHWDTEAPVPRSFFSASSEYKEAREAYETYVLTHKITVGEDGRSLFIFLPYDKHLEKRPHFFVMHNGKNVEMNQLEYDVYTAFNRGIKKNKRIAEAIGRRPPDVSKAFNSLCQKGVILK